MSRTRHPAYRTVARRALLTLTLLVLVDVPAARADVESPTTEGDAGAGAPGVSPGPFVAYVERPAFANDQRACSHRVPVCVHASSERDGPAALDALEAFERAWAILTGALSIPTPDLNPMTLAYDVFVVEHEAELAATHLEARDVRSRVDRASAFTTIDRRVRAGCALDELVTTALARASLWRVAPATDEGTARAQTRYLASLAVPCALGLSGDAVHAFQSRPERTFCDARAGDESAVAGGAEPETSSPLNALFSAGAMLFWARLDWAFGRTPGALVSASWALHPTMSPLGAVRWRNEPDTVDVLRATFKGALTTGSTVDDLWLDFAVARAFVGSADDGLHVPELRSLGDAARVPVDWDIAWPSKARRLTARTPVFPTGSSYVVVRRTGAAAGARLRAEIEWEQHALFRWAFVKLDANGRELGRVVIPTASRATSAQMTLVDLDHVDRILLVGTNVGDPAYYFDPDDEVWEPHGWLLTIAAE